MQDNGRIMKELKELQDGVKNVSSIFYQYHRYKHTYTSQNKLFKVSLHQTIQVVMNRGSSIVSNLK